MMDLSVVVNLHREGNLAYPTLKSVVSAIRKIKDHLLISCEILFIVDNGSEATFSVCNKVRYDNNDLDIFIHKIHEKDLSLSRNYGTNIAKGEYLSFIDGDDVWGTDWLLKAYSLSIQNINNDIIWHPEVNIIFGQENSIFYHTDMEDEHFDIDFLRLANYWTALSFAKRDIYLRFPYVKNRIDAGFGFEDWNWNCTTIFHNIKHKIVKDTCHFIRRKAKGSMRLNTIAKNNLMSPSPLFS